MFHAVTGNESKEALIETGSTVEDSSQTLRLHRIDDINSKKILFKNNLATIQLPITAPFLTPAGTALIARYAATAWHDGSWMA